MLCVAPYKTGLEEFGCGKCLPCKFAKRRTWVGRIMLELLCHRHSCFVTLTFKEAVNEFDPSHLRLFFQSLRRSRGGFRYLAVGERGSKFGRLHYHVALFGVSAAERGCIQKCWRRGFIDVGELNNRSAAYIVKYMLKSADSKPFRRMSQGIGGPAVGKIVASLAPVVASSGLEDVPASIRVSGRVLPLGRYVRSAIRVALGRESRTPASVRERAREEYAAKDSALRERERENSYASALARLSILKSTEKL